MGGLNHQEFVDMMILAVETFKAFRTDSKTGLRMLCVFCDLIINA